MKRITRVTISALALLAAASAPSFGEVTSHLEDFSTTTYRNPFNTTADWNTTDGELRLPPFSPSLVGSYATAQNALDLVIDGDYAYLATASGGLEVLDISNPAAPVQVGSHIPPSSVTGLCLAGDLLFLVVGSSGVRIMDVTNPASPVLVHDYNPAPSINDIFVAGDVAYLATGSYLQLLDISDPTSPVELGFYNHSNLGFGVVVEGNYAFHANSGGSFEVVDVGNSASPFLAGSAPTSAFPSGIAVAGNYAFVCESLYGVEIFDISSPAAPSLAGSIPLAGGARRAFVAGDRLYVAGLTAGLHVYDITSPSSPSLMLSYDTPGTADAVIVEGEHAFIADHGSGIRVVHVRSLPSPTTASEHLSLTNVQAIAVSGNYALVGGELDIEDVRLYMFDISDPASPVVVDWFVPTNTVRGICIDGNYAFVANYYDGLRVFDISNPSNMVLLTTYNTAGPAQDVFAAGDLLFVTTGSSGLQVLDITNPAAPAPLGACDTAGYANDLKVVGDYAYVADQAGGLAVVDVSDPASPALAGTAALAGNAVGVAVSGDYAYLAGQSSGFNVVDVSNPTSPLLILTMSLGGYTESVFVDGDLAFAGGPSTKVLDISDPTSPQVLYSYSPASFADALVVDGDHAFIGSYTGFRIARVFQAEWDTQRNVGQSYAVDGANDLVVRARLAATETPGVSWEVGGGALDPIDPDNTWHLLSAPTNYLYWRATLGWTGTSPVVSDLQLEWLGEFAQIESVEDIPNDQGRQVRVTWRRSGYDFAGDPNQIFEYAVYRWIDPDLTAAAATSRSFEHLSPVGREHALRMAAAGWDYLGTAPVRVQDSYSMVVPTLADSSVSGGQYQTTFMVSALTATPGVFYDSHPDSGWSVDNLAPSVPGNFAIAFNTGSGNALSWDESHDADFQHFRVYRSTDPDFTPDGNTLVHSTASTGWTDPDQDGGGVYYKVTAVDFSGNESDAAESGTVTSIPSQRPAHAWALDVNVPNPFNPTTRIRYTVPPGGGHVTLEVFDVRGRRVRTLVDGAVAPGERAVTWDGRNANGHAVASGVYFYRLTAPGFTQTRKMVLAK